MHRTIGDSFGTSGGKNIFRQEIPSVSDATQVTYDTMNALQEEIANVIEAEGLSLNSASETIASMTQLNSAINLKVAAEATARSAAIVVLNTYWQRQDQAYRHSISGLNMRNNTTDPTNDIDIQAGGANSTNPEPLLSVYRPLIAFNPSGGVMTKRIDAVWAAGNNAGGRASSVSLAAGWYHVFLIARSGVPVPYILESSAHTIDVGFDSSLTAANLKTDTGWGSEFFYRRIGSIYYTGSSIISFQQNDDDFFFTDSTERLANCFEFGSITGPATDVKTVNTPTGVKALAYIRAVCASDSNANDIYFTSSENSLFNALLTTGRRMSSHVQFLVGTNNQIEVSTNSGDTLAYQLTVEGYKDYRGKGF